MRMASSGKMRERYAVKVRGPWCAQRQASEVTWVMRAWDEDDELNVDFHVDSD